MANASADGEALEGRLLETAVKWRPTPTSEER
jgi:hypothetical protein